MTRQEAYKIFDLLKQHYPEAKMILQWGNNFELLVSIILSAQCTDKKVNEVTARVFPKYRKERKELEEKYKEYTHVILNSFQDLSKKMPKQVRHGKITKEELIEIINFAEVPITELEQDIKSTGFYHNKAKNIKAAANVVLEKFHAILPGTIAELTTIPGVGRKTANVFLGNAYHIYEGIAVDTHVTKQSLLLGLTKQKNPEKIEQDLMQLFDQKDWFTLTYLLIEHGRNMRKKKSDRIICGERDCILCK
jgi:endonuclease-3